MPQQVTVEECLDLLRRIGEDIQEYVCAARERGADPAASQALLDEWEQLYRRTPMYWVNHCQEAETPPGLENL